MARTFDDLRSSARRPQDLLRAADGARGQEGHGPHRRPRAGVHRALALRGGVDGARGRLARGVAARRRAGLRRRRRRAPAALAGPARQQPAAQPREHCRGRPDRAPLLRAGDHPYAARLRACEARDGRRRPGAVLGPWPIMIRLAGSGEVVTIDGLGVWPAAASVAFFRREHGGRIPDGLLRTVTPAAPAAWIAALERFGTMSFGDLAGFAIRFAAEGFPVHPTMAEFVAKNVAQYAQFPQNAALYLAGGRPVAVGDRFVQPELAATLQHMVD